MTADSIQSQIDTHAAGTMFCFASGTYVLNHYITLRQAQQFICPVRRTCILTGLDQYRGALTVAYGTTNQVIRGFVVEHFIAQPGVWPAAGLQVRDGGLIDDNEPRFNQIGISLSNNHTVRGNYIHHNRQYGLSGGPSDNVIIENNELAFNNTGHFDPNHDAGGSKIVGSSRGSHAITWRRNHIHDNYGQGIWSDSNVQNALYEENLIENNGGIGIFHELSWDATIRNNTLRNNGTFDAGQGKSCWHSAQIALNNSQNVTISGNVVEAVGVNAICLANTTRPASAPFPDALANVNVIGNTIKLRGVVNVGTVGDRLPSNIVFSGNTYYADVLANPDWSFMTQMNAQQWRAAGHDTDGKFLTW